MTPKQRREIGEAFKAAKPFLWDGHGDEYAGMSQGEFICAALEHVGAEGCNAARSVVMERLEGFGSMQSWLLDQGITLPRFTGPAYRRGRFLLQAHRHAWLDLLIAEFS